MNTRAISVRIYLEGGKPFETQMEIIGNKGQAALARLDHGAGAVGVSTSHARQQMIGLGYQLNDLFVQIQGGANPLTALAQQGSQIVGMYAGQGGVKQAFSQFGQLVTGIFTKFPVMTAVVVGTGLAVAGLTHEINDATGANVSFGDTALAIFQTLTDYVWAEVEPMWRDFTGWADVAWEGIASGVQWAGNLFINSWRVAFKSVEVLFGTLPDIVGAAAVEAANSVIRSIDQMIAMAWKGIQGLVDAASYVLSRIPGNEGFSLGEIPTPPTIGALDNPFAADIAANGTALWGAVQDIMDDDVMGAFFGDIASHAAANAAARREKDKKNGGGGGKNGKEPDPTGFDAMMKSLGDYAKKASDIGKAIGDAIVGGFDAAADAVANFVKTGKFDIASLVTDMLAQFARLATQHWITGPLAGLAGNIFKGIGGGFGAAMQGALTSFDGGGWTGNGPRSGGLDGRGGFLAVMHPREEVYDTTRGQRPGGTGIVMNVYTSDAQSFARSRTQIAADAARMLAAARRGM